MANLDRHTLNGNPRRGMSRWAWATLLAACVLGAITAGYFTSKDLQEWMDAQSAKVVEKFTTKEAAAPQKAAAPKSKPVQAPAAKAPEQAPAAAPVVPSVAQPEDVYLRYMPVRGDTASKLFRNWREVCQDNDLGAKCYLIVGQAVKYKPGNLKGKSGAAPAKKAEVLKQVSKPTAPKPEAACIALGIAPWNRSHSKARMLAGINHLTTLTQEQKVLARKAVISQRATRRYIGVGLDGERLEEMLFWSAAKKGPGHVYGKPICGPKPQAVDEWQIDETTIVGVADECGNPYVKKTVPPMKKPVPEPKPVPQPEPEPKPVPEPKLVPQPEPKPKPKLPPVLTQRPACPLDFKAVVGVEWEPRRNGNDALSAFGSGAAYCTWRGKNGTHGIGIAVQGAAWTGHVNNGAGKFDGYLFVFGPSYEYLADAGWDFQASLMFGNIHEAFAQGSYESSRKIGIVGPAVSFNDYRRRLAGHTLMTETQLFGFVGFGKVTEASQSVGGINLPDTSALEEFGLIVQAGLRQWIREKKGQPGVYGQIGLFIETPTSASMSLRIGIADSNRVCGIHAGVDLDLKNGGDPIPAIGAWCDLVKAVRVQRTAARLAHVREEVTMVGGTTHNGLTFASLASESPAVAVERREESVVNSQEVIYQFAEPLSD